MAVQIEKQEVERPIGVGTYEAYVVTDPDHPGVCYSVPVSRADEELAPEEFLRQQFARQVLAAAGRPDPAVSGTAVAEIKMDGGLITGQANVGGQVVEVQLTQQDAMDAIRDGVTIDDAITQRVAEQAVQKKD